MSTVPYFGRRQVLACRFLCCDGFSCGVESLFVKVHALATYFRSKVHALVACFRSKVLGNYVHDCSRFTVSSDRTIFYPGTLWICQLLPLLTSPAFRNRIQTCRISACLYSTSVFLSCQYFRSQNMQNIRTF